MSIIETLTLDDNTRVFYDKYSFHKGDGLSYSTQFPTSDNYSGFKIIVVEEEPEVRKKGYVYFVTEKPVIKNWLKFTSEESGCTVRIVWTDKDNVPSEFINLEYSINKINWHTFTPGILDEVPYSGTIIPLTDKGTVVYIRGNNTTINDYSNSGFYKFVFNGDVSSGGNVMSMINKNCAVEEFKDNCSISKLFKDCNTLISPPELPATKLSKYCYSDLFYGCSKMTEHPELPATNLVEGCYNGMFNGCSSLWVSDSGSQGQWNIPSDDVASGDYEMTDMFKDCGGSRSTDSPNFNGIKKSYYNAFYITPILVNVTADSSNPSIIRIGESATLKFTADEGYALPDTVTVTGADGSWTKDTGVLILSNPISDVSFKISGVQE